jgi:hypothetical protein
MIALALPAVGAAIRTYRSGRESARNHLRCATLHNALASLGPMLASTRPVADQVRAMVLAEYELEREHQQWLQLTKESDWYA